MTKVKESIRTHRPARTRKPFKGQRVGYLRVSSLDQNEVRQLEGLALNKTFTDKASGKDVKRPQLEAMLSFVREGDTVFCHSMDRLARNLDDLRRIVLGLTERGVHIVFVKENLTFTGEDSPMSNLLLNVMGRLLIMRSLGLCEATAVEWRCGLHISDVSLRIIPDR